MQATMTAAIYAPPTQPLPYILIVFHTDESILICKPFDTSEAAPACLLNMSETFELGPFR